MISTLNTFICRSKYGSTGCLMAGLFFSLLKASSVSRLLQATFTRGVKVPHTGRAICYLLEVKVNKTWERDTRSTILMSHFCSMTEGQLGVWRETFEFQWSSGYIFTSSVFMQLKKDQTWKQSASGLKESWSKRNTLCRAMCLFLFVSDGSN